MSSKSLLSLYVICKTLCALRVPFQNNFIILFAGFHRGANNFASTMKAKSLFYLVALILVTSCERTIDLKVNDQPAKLVVDASIENNGSPLVVLSKSLNYFSTI